MPPRVVLASASPSRRRLLENSGISPEIIISGVDEESPEYSTLSPRELVVALAIVKAHTVKRQILDVEPDIPTLIIGCDSTFEFEGQSLGKPLTPESAMSRSRLLSGKSGLLHTGHSIIDTQNGIEVSDVVTTRVHFTEISEKEIQSYVETGEPLHVAGGFTLDGISAPLIAGIEGDPSNVIGLSLPLVRKIFRSLGYEWFDFVNLKGLKN
jgi:septum formation protein